MNLNEEIYYDNLSKQLLDEGLFSKLITGAVKLLGYTSLTGLTAIGAAVLAKSALSNKGKLKKFCERVFKKRKYNFEFDENTSRPSTTRELSNYEKVKQNIPDVFTAIKQQDWEEAAKLYKESKYDETEDGAKAIAIAVADVMDEPPLFVYPQGNKVYFVLKQIVGIKYAKAITNAVLAALRIDKTYYNEFNNQDLKVGENV